MTHQEVLHGKRGREGGYIYDAAQGTTTISATGRARERRLRLHRRVHAPLQMACKWLDCLAAAQYAVPAHLCGRRFGSEWQCGIVRLALHGLHYLRIGNAEWPIQLLNTI